MDSPATGGDGPSAECDAAAAVGGTGGGATEIAAAIAETDDGIREAVESALAGRSGLVAVGVPLALFPSVLAAREGTDGEPWRVACRPEAVDALGRAFALGTAVAEAVERGEIELRTVGPGETAADSADRGPLFATPERVDALAGPREDRTLVTETRAANAAGAAAAARARFEAATSAAVDMPSRSRLLASARETLDDRFADDVAAVLDALEYGAVGRVGAITDRTLLLALAARHDHLLRDLRRWIGTEREAGVGIAPGQELTDDRRALVERELIEAIRVPMGDGRPRLRLRAVDEALLRARPDEVLSVLRGRFALPLAEDGTLRRGPGHDDRRPVWERRRRRRDKN
ncbi:DUF5821 family protein [Halorubrum sp. AD140]|uniref:transcriptional regulator TbsP domain-containing protein n=1 Tax=Halorubrum sp. AD140 TaxID=3050073 RepID=UPI002ACCC68F|nr:DUF5821 family protein [Halorubrum sp. AD140]MDZ5812496.1 DUF5821 family protein [Halorubrum sp. AD140]